jgi:hypothetical protein
MNFDFFIQDINFKFNIRGKGDIKLFFNGTHVDNCHVTKNIKENNVVEIMFSKDDPSDVDSYAILEQVFINGFDCVDRFKEIEYHIDKSKHIMVDNVIPNNLYFGYIGRMTFALEHKNDLLSQAAWLLADKEFTPVKWPLKGDNFRKKDFDTLCRDSLYMFTGCQPPQSEEISKFVEQLNISETSNLVQLLDAKEKIEAWINRSARINLKNFNSMNHFTVSNGVTESLSNVLCSNKVLYMNEKMYYHNREFLEDKNVTIKDLHVENLDKNSTILMELPSPWYDTHSQLEIIKKAKQANCHVALDLTWLPLVDIDIEFDLDLVDEIFFSMNKGWPIQQLRPAFRWSKKRINDSQTFDTEYGMYPKVPVNVFMKLTDQFEIDYTYNQHKTNHRNICKKFDLEPTEVLWFTKHKNVTHDHRHYISNHFYLDDFVCVVNLLNHKDKYFW